MSRPPTATLAFAAVLACVLAAECVPLRPASNATGAHVAETRRAAVDTMPVREAGTWSSDILARPLFSESRRPPKARSSAASAPPPGARLAGIMLGANQPPLAIFAPAGGGKSVALSIGGAIDGKVIARILPERVVMTDGAILSPTYDKDKAAAGAGGTPAATFEPFGQPPMTLSNMDGQAAVTPMNLGGQAPVPPPGAGGPGADQRPPQFATPFFRLHPVPMPQMPLMPPPPVPPEDVTQGIQP
jgi:hypothetical protein